MDLKDIIVNDTFKFKIKDPVHKKETDFEIEVFSPESTESIRAQAEFAVAQRVATSIEDSEKKINLIRQAVIRLLASMTKSWSGLTDDGKEVKFSIEKAIEVYKSKYIADQVDFAVSNAGNFYKVKLKK